MAQINKQFADMITKYGASHVVFQLNNTSTPMKGIVNIAKTIAASDDEEVWMVSTGIVNIKKRSEQRCKMTKA